VASGRLHYGSARYLHCAHTVSGCIQLAPRGAVVTTRPAAIRKAAYTLCFRQPRFIRIIFLHTTATSIVASTQFIAFCPQLRGVMVCNFCCWLRPTAAMKWPHSCMPHQSSNYPCQATLESSQLLTSCARTASGCTDIAAIQQTLIQT
jgi:hypothetical protein